MKHLILTLAAILFFTSFTFAQSLDADRKCQEQSEKVATLAHQYRELRNKRRRLPEGEFDKDLSDYRGKLHKVLVELASELGHPPFTKKNIVACLGEPDAIRNHKQMNRMLGIYERELSKAGRKIEVKKGRQYLVYWWRGWHDFLFFISEDGVIVDHGWWFAYE